MPNELCGGDVCISLKDLKMMGDRIDQAGRERDELRAQLAEANTELDMMTDLMKKQNAACAQLREALRLALDCRVCIVDEDENPKYVELRLTREARLAVSKALSSIAGKDLLERVRRAEGLLRRVGELQKVDINSALDAIDDPLGQQAAAWGSDWTDLLSAIDAFLKAGGKE